MRRKGTKKKTGKEFIPKKNKKIRRLRGMKDILFSEYRYWDLVNKKARDLAEAYSFRSIATPILEKYSLFEEISGKNKDVVSKELYNFIDRSGEKVAIRPEATPGLIRAYLEHGMFNLPQPVKMFWLGPILRHTQPRNNPWRQQTQFDLEIMGEENAMAEAQLILIAYNFFSELQINVQVQINSLGCKDCRTEYSEKLEKFYKERGKRTKLCNDCKKNFVKDPILLLGCAESGCQEVREEAPQIVDFLCDSCRDHFIKVLEYLDELEVPYNLNPFLIREFKYYNRTVFEFNAVNESVNNYIQEQKISEAKDESKSNKHIDTGKKNLVLGGGGRYDELIENIIGKPTPACGFAIGMEQVIRKIKENNIPFNKEKQSLIFIAQLGEQAKRKVVVLFEEMRRAGYKVRQSFTQDSLKSQLDEATRIGAKYSLILGQKELIDGTIIIRDMDSGTQEVIDYKKIYSELNKRLEEKEENNKINR